MGDGFTIRALTPGTWDAFAALVERHNGIFGGCLVHLLPPRLRGVERLQDYRLTCIFIHRDYRRQKISALALQGSLDLIAKASDGVVEGYPQDTSNGRRVGNSFLHNGTPSLYERAGLTYQRPKGKNHTVMRRTVAAA